MARSSALRGAVTAASTLLAAAVPLLTVPPALALPAPAAVEDAYFHDAAYSWNQCVDADPRDSSTLAPTAAIGQVFTAQSTGRIAALTTAGGGGAVSVQTLGSTGFPTGTKVAEGNMQAGTTRTVSGRTRATLQPAAGSTGDVVKGVQYAIVFANMGAGCLLTNLQTGTIPAVGDGTFLGAINGGDWQRDFHGQRRLVFGTEVVATPLTAGNPLIRRGNVDTASGVTVLDTNKPVTVAGTIGQFGFYAQKQGRIQLVVARANGTLTWVSPSITVSTVGTTGYVPAAPVPVLAGDLLGIRLDQGVIPFDYVGAKSRYNGAGAVGQVVGDVKESRTYSLYAMANTSESTYGITAVPQIGSSWTVRQVAHGGAPAGWEQPSFDDTNWATGNAPFASHSGACGFPARQSNWNSGTQLLMRKHLTLPAGAFDVQVHGTIDNSEKVYFNGKFIGEWFDGNCNQGGTQFTVPAAELKLGADNVVAVLAHDNQDGGSSFAAPYVTYSLDNVDPGIYASTSVQPSSTGWFGTRPTVTPVCTDTGGAGVAICSAPVLLEDGPSRSVTATAVDGAGRTATATFAAYKVDTAAPVLTASVPAPPASGWFTSNVPVTWTCGPQLSTVACPPPSVIGGEGRAQQTTGVATSGAGLSTTVLTPTVPIDRTAPSTTLSGNGADWTRHVSLTATDNLSGVASTSYSLDGGPTVPLPTDGRVAIAGDGVHTIAFSSVDAAGNAEPTRTATVRYDTTAPFITPLLDPAPVAGWNNGPVSVGFACTDPGSLLTPATGSGIASCTLATPVVAEGTTDVAGTAVDNADNRAAITASARLDLTAPVAAPTVSTTTGENGWHKAPATVTFACTDPAGAGGAAPSGVDACPTSARTTTDGKGVTVDAGIVSDLAGNTAAVTTPPVDVDQTKPTITGTIVSDQPASAEGWYRGEVRVRWTCTDQTSGIADGACPADTLLTEQGAAQTASGSVTDRAGNTASTTVGGIDIDLTRPVITGAPAGTARNGWFNTDVTVNYTCNDRLSGIAADGGCPAPLTVTDEGRDRPAQATARDKAGNTTTETVLVSLDKTDPALQAQLSPAPNAAGWNNSPVTVRWTATDDSTGSGIDPDTTPGVAVLDQDGADQAASAKVRDLAGNTRQATSLIVNIDQKAPVTSADAPTAWTGGSVIVRLSPTDGHSGVASTQYSVDGGPTRTGDEVELVTEGVHTLTYSSTDVAGNVEQDRTTTVRIDKTAPVITHSLSTQPNSAGWHRGAVTVSFSCEDPASADAPNASSGIASCTPAVEQEHDTPARTVDGEAVDNAGNRADDSVTLHVDSVPPVVAGTTAPANGNGWHREPIVVSWSCGDEGGSTVASCPADSLVAKDGSALSATSGEALDVAGNAARGTLTGLKLDQVAPTVTVTPLTAPNSAGWYAADVTVRTTATDEGGSGVDAATIPADEKVVTGSSGNVISSTVADLAGNVGTGSSPTIRIDKTAPALTYTLAPAAPNSRGWYDGAVTVTFACTDQGSGVASCPAPVTRGEGRHAAFDATATDIAGHGKTVTVPALDVDMTAPVLAFTGNLGTYAVDQTVEIGCRPTDALSGLAVSACPTVSAPAYTLALGVTTLHATATDLAGNTASASTSYTTVVTSGSLCQLVKEFSNNAEWHAGLCAKADQISAATAKGSAKAGLIGAFTNQVTAKTGKGFTQAQAGVLTRLAANL